MEAALKIHRSCFAISVVLLAVLTGCSKSNSDAFEKGKAFLDKGELASAVIELKNAVQAEESSLDARVALGEALERTGDLIGAEQNYRRALEMGGDADNLVPRIAVLLMDKADFKAIVRDFADKQLALPSADSELRGIVSVAELSLGKKEAAKAQLARAETNAPAVKLARAQMAIATNRPSDALTELESVLEEGKAPWWVLRAASRVYAAQGDHVKAVAMMKSAYELAGAHQSVVGEYAEQLYRAGQRDEAKSLFDKLRQIAPRYYRTAYLEALFLAEQGKLDEARDTAQKVLSRMPDHAPSLLLAATIELDNEELATAATHIERLLSKDPASLQALRLKLRLDLRNRDIKSATTILEQALKIAPDDRGLLAASSELAWARGDKTGALRQLTAAVERQPPEVGLLARLAEMKFATGKRDEALQLINRAMALAKDDPGARSRLFWSVVGMNMLDKAKEMARVEIERSPRDPGPVLWHAALFGMEGDEKAALEQTIKALDIQSDYYPALTALARTANTTERAKEYGSRLEKAVDEGTSNPRIYIDFARRLVDEGADPERVGGILVKGMAAAPSSVAMRKAAIDYWLAQRKNDKAVAVAAEGEASHADDPALKELVAATQVAVGNFDQASAKYAELNALNPDRFDWGLENARTLLRAGRSQDAALALRKLISQHPEIQSAYTMLAFVQVDQKQLQDALLTAEILANKPKLRTAGLLLRGDIHARAQDKVEAIKAYDEAAKAGAAEEALMRKVQLYDRMGGAGSESVELNDWLKSHPNSLPVLAFAARRATLNGDYQAAIRYLEKIVKLSPRDAVAINELAWTYVLTRNPAALSTAQRAIALLPNNPLVLDTLAGAQAQVGKKAEAIANLRMSMSMAPRNPVIKVHLAELLADQGDKKQAGILIEGLDKVDLDTDTVRRLQNIKAKL